MEIKLKFPTTFYKQDPEGYDLFFKAIQGMLDRMAMSHPKYQGDKPMKVVVEKVDEIYSALQRIRMYTESKYITDVICGKAPDTGNVENLLDAANMLVIESIFPKHPESHFRSQSSHESPGLKKTK